MKKFIMIALVLCLGIICPFVFAACGSEKAQSTVMNVSLNPEVEFILDENNKVVSVNALNEEGNLIINGQVFVGKTSEEAVELFISISKETGFLVTGNVKAGENQLNISFSGDSKKAEQLYNDIKSKVDEYLTEENITATLNKVEGLTQEYLQKAVEKCAPYLEEAKIKAMSYQELLNELVESRKETAKLYSQELKEAYYNAKAEIVNQEKFDYLKSQLNAVQKIAFDAVYENYTTAKSTLQKTRNSLFVDENSAYQKALTAFRTAKTEYLNYRNYVAGLEENKVTTAINNELDRLENVLNSAETALNNAYNIANAEFDKAEQTLDTVYDAVVKCLTDFGKDVNNAIDNIQSDLETALANFENSFETEYNEEISKAKAEWKNMKDDLVAGYVA